MGQDDQRINISLRELDRLEKEANVIAISIYVTASKFSNNHKFAWNITIVSSLIQLANDIRIFLPSWILRVYVDFTGSSSSQ